MTCCGCPPWPGLCLAPTSRSSAMMSLSSISRRVARCRSGRHPHCDLQQLRWCLAAYPAPRSLLPMTRQSRLGAASAGHATSRGPSSRAHAAVGGRCRVLRRSACSLRILVLSCGRCFRSIHRGGIHSGSPSRLICVVPPRSWRVPYAASRVRRRSRS